MKTSATISASKKAKRPFMQQGKKDPFIKKNGAAANGTKRINKEEDKAGAFARQAGTNAAIVQAYQQARGSLKRPAVKKGAAMATAQAATAMKQVPKPPEADGLDAFPLPASLVAAFKIHLGEDFAEVRLYADPLSTKIAKEHNAAAFTLGDQIFFNTDVFKPGTPEGLSLLAHELFHTIEPVEGVEELQVQLKPLTELTDRTPYQQMALERAAKIAMGEQGKVNSGALNEDKTRVGWQFLLEYFRTTFGDEQIVKSMAEYKPGKFLEDHIKYVHLGKATKIVVNKEGEHVPEVKDKVDTLPSWCGIFAFWALHKSGIHPPPWQVGKPNFTSADAYKKNEYLPRPGDIVIKNGYNHHALVVRTDPVKVTDSKDLANVKVTTINGNTAGSNHTGGQIQVKTDPYSYWDYYVNPFFKGVELTAEKDFKLDDRLKEQAGGGAGTATPKSGISPANTSINTYNTSLEPVGLSLPKGGEAAKPGAEKVEESPLSPKQIMAKDVAYAELQGSLNRNAKNQQQHDPPEQKAGEAQSSAQSPANERLSRAKAIKVEALEALPRPAPFKAETLKENILAAVRKMLAERKEKADGEKPTIEKEDVDGVKTKSKEDIGAQKQQSIGAHAEAQKQPPNEEAVAKRESAEVIVEDPGPDKNIPHSEKAVAKPIADERITLEKESGKIDAKMAENDVDEQQLEESNEEKFTGALGEKRGSQAQAADIKKDYRNIEAEKLAKDKKIAKASIDNQVDQLHEVRKGEFGNVNTVKDATKTADEGKRKEISDKIEKLYTDAEKSVNDKLTSLETTVNTEFDAVMATAIEHFKKNVNDGLDEEFTWEWASKTFSRSDYDARVMKVFNRESKKYEEELSEALNPLTTKIAKTLNAIVDEIEAAKTAVKVFVDGLDPSLKEIGVASAKAVMEKFKSLQDSVNEKQEALTNGLAKKYADGVMALEEEFKKIMDSRKSWLEKALDAIVDAIKEIINLLSDLKKALERAAEYGKRIIKAPLKFFGNLCKGASEGFNNFVKNIAKHLLQGALEWITGEMGEAGITLPEKFDFKGILSIILQILGLTVANVKEIAKKVIGEKYVTMLEKGADLGVKAADKILQIFTIIKKDGLAGLWEFIKEQFNDLKEKLMEEAKSFIITTIIEAAVIKVVGMLIPGAGFITAVKSLIDFLRTLFAKARQIVNIITGIIDTFGEILAGNVGKVAGMVENVLAKFLSLAITFLAAILGLGKIGKKINDIIQKKIKDPINKAITKMMEKLKQLMTKLGIFKFLDKVDDKIQGGKKWIEDKKEKAKQKLNEGLAKMKGFVKNLFKPYTDQSGEKHSLRIEDRGRGLEVIRHSVSENLQGYLNELDRNNNKFNSASPSHGTYKNLIATAKRRNKKLEEAIAKTWTAPVGEEIRAILEDITGILKQLPANIGKNQSAIPEVKVVNWGSPFVNHYSVLLRNSTLRTNSTSSDGLSVTVPLLSLHSKNFVGSEPTDAGSSHFWNEMHDSTLTFKNRVRGHLLNHQLWGTGTDVKNLGPIPKQANNDMKTVFETPAKDQVHSGDVLYYYVKYTYGDPNDSAGKIAKRFPGIQLPTRVYYEVRKLALLPTTDATKQAEVDDPGKWTTASTTGVKYFKINHDDFF